MGSTAANNLGLTNAVPAKVTVWTDARLKPIQLRSSHDQFPNGRASRLVWAGRPAAQVVQALIWLRDVLPSDQDQIKRRLAKNPERPRLRPTHSRRSGHEPGRLPTWLFRPSKICYARLPTFQITIPDPAAIQYPEDDLDERHGANHTGAAGGSSRPFPANCATPGMRAREYRKGFLGLLDT